MKRTELWYRVTAKDSSGKVASSETRESRSLLKAWLQMTWRQMRGANITIKDISGANRACIVADMVMNRAANDDTYGIVIGTGNTVVAIDDYKLETKIDHGTGAGQMQYLVCGPYGAVVSAPHCTFEVERVFVNNSGSAITVRESGVYMRIVCDPGQYVGCVVRDVFTTPQDVPDGGSITVNYFFRVTA